MRLDLARERLFRHLQFLGFETRQNYFLDHLSGEVVESSLIEQEIFSIPAVRSSIAQKLKLESAVPGIGTEKRAEGIIQLLLDATQNFRTPLDEPRLMTWHSQLLAHDRVVLKGAYRRDSISVISGAHGRETVHFEGPPPERVAGEMATFFHWLNGPDSGQLPLVVKSALAHLWFVTIHPYEDGNGRLARAIGEYLLANWDQSAERFYGISAALNADRRGYYEALERSQKGGLDVTEWLVWSLEALERGMHLSQLQVRRTVAHSEIWRQALEAGMNLRQRKMLPKLLQGFDGPVTTRKWATICQCSQDTATRDIQDWLDLGILIKGDAGGRSTHYALVDAEAVLLRTPLP